MTVISSRFIHRILPIIWANDRCSEITFYIGIYIERFHHDVGTLGRYRHSIYLVPLPVIHVHICDNEEMSCNFQGDNVVEINVHIYVHSN